MPNTPETGARVRGIPGRHAAEALATAVASGCGEVILLDGCCHAATVTYRIGIEIKPSADSQSLFTAVGQLMKHSTNKPAKQRVLVAPVNLRRDRIDSLKN